MLLKCTDVMKTGGIPRFCCWWWWGLYFRFVEFAVPLDIQMELSSRQLGLWIQSWDGGLIRAGDTTSVVIGTWVSSEAIGLGEVTKTKSYREPMTQEKFLRHLSPKKLGWIWQKKFKKKQPVILKESKKIQCHGSQEKRKFSEMLLEGLERWQ